MWEGLREGFCDLRVAATLEQSLEANPQAPQEVQDAARKALANPALLARYSEAGLETIASTPEQFRKFIDQEYERWARLIRQAGITAQ